VRRRLRRKRLLQEPLGEDHHPPQEPLGEDHHPPTYAPAPRRRTTNVSGVSGVSIEGSRELVVLEFEQLIYNYSKDPELDIEETTSHLSQR